MAYNNGFPMNYQQMYPYQQPQPVQQPVQNNGMIWIQGEAGAKSYLLTPNTTVPLWDSEQSVIYLKSTDASGMPTMKILDYTIREPQGQQQKATVIDQSIPDYVTHKELSDLEDKITKKIEELAKPTPTRKKREDIEE